ncbi:hypothetical protein [Actinoplanes sp. NPDC051411]|uniref:hypothetical protein n=1 Tax=Actinoplanes sp. NPDC051411 TaxID=3155522 RepID=UPI0034317219
MNASMDPADAARDLQTAAAGRRALADATRRPLWIYPTLFVYTVTLFALEDFVPKVGFGVALAIAFLYALGQWAPGLRLRVRSRFGLRVSAATDVVPRHTRIALRAAMLIVVIGSLLLLDNDHPLAGVGAPAWAVRHTITVYGVAFAILMMPFTWLVDRVTRHYLMRGMR